MKKTARLFSLLLALCLTVGLLPTTASALAYDNFPTFTGISLSGKGVTQSGNTYIIEKCDDDYDVTVTITGTNLNKDSLKGYKFVYTYSYNVSIEDGYKWSFNDDGEFMTRTFPSSEFSQNFSPYKPHIVDNNDVEHYFGTSVQYEDGYTDANKPQIVSLSIDGTNVDYNPEQQNCVLTENSKDVTITVKVKNFDSGSWRTEVDFCGPIVEKTEDNDGDWTKKGLQWIK